MHQQTACKDCADNASTLLKFRPRAITIDKAYSSANLLHVLHDLGQNFLRDLLSSQYLEYFLHNNIGSLSLQSRNQIKTMQVCPTLIEKQ